MRTKTWKLIPFAMVALMVTHLVLLQVSMIRYTSFPEAAWYQDGNKMFILIFYSLPILAVLGLNIASFIMASSMCSVPT